MFKRQLGIIKSIAIDMGTLFINNIQSRPFKNKTGFPEPYCRDCSRYSSYCIVEDEVWNKIPGDNPSDIFLCFHCMEKRLGRKLTFSDLKYVPANEPYFLGRLM